MSQDRSLYWSLFVVYRCKYGKRAGIAQQLLDEGNNPKSLLKS